MPNEVRVPQMGESVTEATILRWLKKVGETVSAGDPIAELETDKVNVEVPAESAGVIQSFAHAEGDTVAVGDQSEWEFQLTTPPATHPVSGC